MKKFIKRTFCIWGCILGASLTAAMGVPYAASAAESAVWDGTADTGWFTGDSKEFHLKTAEEFAGLAELVNDGNNFNGCSVYIDNDIILNDTANYDSWETKPPKNNWTTIGNAYNRRFKGKFYGGGHRIVGLYMKEDRDANENNNIYYGMFGILDENGYIGGVRAEQFYYYVENTVLVTANVSASPKRPYVGGIVGDCFYAKIEDCSFSGIIKNRPASYAFEQNGGWSGGSGIAGGICASATGSKITRCTSEGAVSVLPVSEVKENTVLTAAAGGISGTAVDVTFTECRNSAEIRTASFHTSASGGITGVFYDETIFESCLNTGALYTDSREESSFHVFTAYSACGGIAGLYDNTFPDGSPVFRNCLAIGSMECKGMGDSWTPGGIAATLEDEGKADKYPIIFENNYYLEGLTEKSYFFDPDNDMKTVTAEELKTEAFAKALGDKYAYVKGSDHPVLAWEAAEPAAVKKPAVKGDANCDGKFTVADLVTFSRGIMGVDPMSYYEELDLCADGRLDAFDVVVMRQMLFSKKK